MMESRPETRVEPWKRLSTPTGLEAWQRRGAADRSSFFFSWGGALSGSGDDLAGAEFLLSGVANNGREDRQLRADRRRSQRDLAFNPDVLIASGRDDFELSDDCLSASSALHDRTKNQSDPDRFIDPLGASFVTLSVKGTFRATGVRLGDVVTVWNPRTDLYAHAIVGDSTKSDGAKPSTHLAGLLRLDYGDEAVYLVHPGTGRGQGVIPTAAEIDQQGERLLYDPPADSGVSWAAIVAEFLNMRLRSS